MNRMYIPYSWEYPALLCSNMDGPKEKEVMVKLLKLHPEVELEIRDEAFDCHGRKIDGWWSLWWTIRPKTDMSWFWKKFEEMLNEQ